MTSMTPSNAATEELIVDLASIRQDPTWPVDLELIESFRASISRGGPPLLDLSLNRIRLDNGTVALEIIDGMHRFEALRLEGVASHAAKVREYSPQDAFYARIATSIGKPNELFRQRAEKALREGFIRDVAGYLEGATLYQHGVDDKGVPRPKRRREPLPADPLLALGTILWVHFAAKPEITEDWERYILSWLDDIASRLGKTPAWLRDEVLNITALLGNNLPGKPAAARTRLLLAIPDEGILRLVLARLKAEPQLTTTDLRFALDILGCGPDLDRHSWLKHRSLPEMRSMLAHATLAQLARDYSDALIRADVSARVINRPASVDTSSFATALPEVPTASSEVGGIPPPSSAVTGASGVEPSSIFGIVSSKFAGTVPHSSKAKTLASVSAVAPSEDLFMPARHLIISLIRAWKTFDEQTGDWSRTDVQEDLSRLRTVIDNYLTRGNSSELGLDTRNVSSRKRVE